MPQSVGSIQIDFTGNIKKLMSATDRVDKRLDQLQKSAFKVKKNIANFAKAAVGIYAVGKAFQYAESMASSFVNTAAKFERFETVLQTIEGSSEAAKRSMDWIADFAQSTPYNIDKVTESFVKLKAYGIDPTDGTLKTLGDTASAMGKPIIQAVEAMADALTGENERLKEFGIKASKQGEKIAYRWTDSSGKARHIIIQNNKEIIQSTLEAIMNEKYSGAMADQAKTWSGVISNIQDQWTNFQRTLMDGGLFTYLKAIAVVVGEHLKKAFDDTGKKAASFSMSIITGIEGLIKSFGVARDALSLFSSSFGFLKAAFWEMVGSLGMGMNAIQKGWNTLSNTMSTIWVDLANGVKEIFQGIINYIVDKVNYISRMVNGASSKLGLDPILGELEHVSFDKTKAEINSLVEPISNVETAWLYAKEAQNSYKQEWENVLKGKGQSEAIDFIKEIKNEYAELNKTIQKTAKIKADVIGKAGDFKGFEKAAKKAIKNISKKAKEENHKYAEDFASAFEGILGGDVFSAFKSFFNNLSTTLVTPWVENLSKNLSDGLESMLSSLGGFGSALVGIGLGLLGNMLGSFMNQEETPPELPELVHVSESMKNALDEIRDVQYPLLTYTKEMTGHLIAIESGFTRMKNDLIVSQTDFGGNLYQDSYKKGFLFGGKSTSFYGSTLDFDKINYSDALMGYISATLDTITKTTSKKWWGGKKTYFTHHLSEVGGEFQETISRIFIDSIDLIQTLGDRLDIDPLSLDSIEIDLPKFDISNKSNEEVAQMVEAAFNAQMDVVAEQMFGSMLDEFQHAGEGLLETASRVAATFDQVSYSMSQIGQGVSWQTANYLVDAAGGLSEYFTIMHSFQENYYTEEEKLARLRNDLNMQFTSLGISMPTTNNELRNLIESFEITDKTSAETFASLLRLSDSFYKANEAAQQLVNSKFGSVFSDIVDDIERARSELERSVRAQIANVRADYDKRSGIIGSLKNNQKTFLPQTNVTSASIYNDIANWTLESNNDIEASIKAFAQQQINTYKAAEEVRVKAINKEIELSNKLYDTVVSAQNAVASYFIDTLATGKHSFYDAMQNKDYASLGSSFSQYAERVMDRTGGSLEGLLELAYANRAVQNISKPTRRDPVEINTASIDTYTQQINKQAADMYAALIKTNEEALPNVDETIAKLLSDNRSYFADGSEFVAFMERGATDLGFEEQQQKTRRKLDALFASQRSIENEQTQELKRLNDRVDRLSATNIELLKYMKKTASNTEKPVAEEKAS